MAASSADSLRCSSQCWDDRQGAVGRGEEMGHQLLRWLVGRTSAEDLDPDDAHLDNALFMLVWDQSESEMTVMLGEKSPLCSKTGDRGNFCLIGKRDGIDMLKYLADKCDARCLSGGEDEALVCLHLGQVRAEFSSDASALYMGESHTLLQHGGKEWDQTLDLREKV